jgi:hypothetical protein
VTVEDYFRKIVDTVLGKRTEIARMIALHESDPDWTKEEERCLKRLFGLGEEVSEAELNEQLADVLADSEIDALLTALEGNGEESSKDQGLRETAYGLQGRRRLRQGSPRSNRFFSRLRTNGAKQSAAGACGRQSLVSAPLSIARKVATLRSPSNVRSLLAPRRVPRCFCSPTRSKPSMSVPSKAGRARL